MTSTNSDIGLPSKSIRIRKKKNLDIYSNAIISQISYIPITNVGSNIKEVLEQYISNKIGGKCISEGYIKPNSIKIISYSNGVVEGTNIRFEVVIEMKVCSPVEGTQIRCIVKNITKAGIRAEVDEDPTPVVIFIARDHNYMSKNFSSIKEKEEIKVRVIGQRYELNDKYISIIAELITDKSKSTSNKSQLSISSKSSDIDIAEIPYKEQKYDPTYIKNPPTHTPTPLTPPYDPSYDFDSPPSVPPPAPASPILSHSSSPPQSPQSPQLQLSPQQKLQQIKSSSQFAPPEQYIKPQGQSTAESSPVPAPAESSPAPAPAESSPAQAPAESSPAQAPAESSPAQAPAESSPAPTQTEPIVASAKSRKSKKSAKKLIIENTL